VRGCAKDGAIVLDLVFADDHILQEATFDEDESEREKR
jgi:hypothetical protein